MNPTQVYIDNTAPGILTDAFYVENEFLNPYLRYATLQVNDDSNGKLLYFYMPLGF